MSRSAKPVTPAESRRLRAQPGATLALDLTRIVGASLKGHPSARAYRLPDGRVLVELSPDFCVVYQSEAVLTRPRMSPEEHFTRPWSDRRGNDASDGNYGISAVMAPPAVVTAALAIGRAGVAHDVLGLDVPAAPVWMFVARLQGHAWTLVVTGLGSDDGTIAADLNELSRTDGVKVVHFEASDTMGSLSYQLFEDGIEVEHLRSRCNEVESFASSRGSKVPAPDDVHERVDELLREIDLYMPPLSGEYFVGDDLPARGKWPVRSPGWLLGTVDGKDIAAVPPFESVDYVWGRRTTH